MTNLSLSVAPSLAMCKQAPDFFTLQIILPWLLRLPLATSWFPASIHSKTFQKHSCYPFSRQHVTETSSSPMTSMLSIQRDTLESCYSETQRVPFHSQPLGPFVNSVLLVFMGHILFFLGSFLVNPLFNSCSTWAFFSTSPHGSSHYFHGFK